MKLWLATILLPAVALAHEGHAPLPTKGTTVKGDRLMLSASAAQAIGMQLGKVELAEVQRTVHAVGTVELPWSQQAYVSTLVAGRVERILVRPGDSVAAGQELARISGAELERLQLEMLQAAAESSLATRMLKGQLSAGEGIAGKVLLQTQTEAQQQSARYNAACQKLRAIGLSNETIERIRDTGQTVPTISVNSPIRGIVSMADARAGQFVQPTEHLYHIVDPSQLWIVGKILEADAGQVHPGQAVEASVAVLPDRLVTRIDHTELRLNSDRTLSVTALLDNTKGILKPGMFGTLNVRVASAKAVVCPTEALFGEGATVDVLVQQSTGNYLRKPAVVGAVHGARAEIDDGLFPGDKVVTVGSHELAALFPHRTAAASENSDRIEGTTVQAQVEMPTDQIAFATAPIDGLVRRILVHHGQRVEKGEVLAELASLPFTSLQLEFLQARAALRQAGLNLERAQLLGENLARKDLWQMQTQHVTLRQSVASLRRRLALVGLTEAEIVAIERNDLAAAPGELSGILSIRAPADGLVGDFELIPGQFVAQQTTMFELHNPRKVWVRAFVFEQDAPGVRVGQAVRVRLASDPTFVAVGKVDRLDPVLALPSRALSIWTELENPGVRLKEGMAATVTIDASSERN